MADSRFERLASQAKEAVRLGLGGFALGAACEGGPPLQDLVRRYAEARGRYDAPVRGFTGDPWTRRRDRGSVES